MSQGVFTCSELLKIQALAQQHFNDDVRQADITPFSVAAQAVLENQTARLAPLQDPTKDRKVSLIWHQSCDLSVQDCGDQCSIEGTEAGSICKDYELTICKSVAVKVREFAFRTQVLSREEVAARQLAEALKTMDEYYAQQVVAFLIANAGTNALTNPYTVSGTTTSIPAANWTPNLMGYLALAMAVNKMSNMFMLSGQNLYVSEFNAAKEAGNADGKGNAAKMATFKKYWDLFNVDAIASPDRPTFLINPNSVALVTKAYYQAVPKEYKMKNNWQIRSSVASPSLPGVTYDLHYTTECANDEVFHQWEVRTKGGLFLNPQGCDNTRTGIIQFNCV